MTSATAVAGERDLSSSAPGTDQKGSGAWEEETLRYQRSPRDVLRVGAFASATLLLLGLTLWVEDSVLGFEQDLIRVFDFLSPGIERIVAGFVQWLGLVISLGLFLVPIVTRRYRLFGYVFVASALAFVLMSSASALVDRNQSTVLVNEIAERAGAAFWETTEVGPVAQFAAAFVAVGPFVSRRWRRLGAGLLAVLALAVLLVSYHLPADVVVAVPLGATCGAAVLLAFGRPDRRPTIGAVRAALAEAGLATSELHAAKVDARGSTPYFGTLQSGDRLFVKVLGEEERAADLLFRLYRWLRFKNIGDERPFSSLRRTVEHEALVSLLARDVGVRTPRMRGVVQVGSDAMLLSYDIIEGSSLDGLPDDAVTDDVMRSVWRQVALLRAHRIAHRDLRRANVFVADDGAAWLIDFGFSEVAVSDSLLDADVAQMLASFAVVAGPERTVAAAIDVLGVDAVGPALPRLQLRALSGATQTALKQHKGLLKDLQQEVIQRCGIEDVRYEQLQRLDRKTLIMSLVAVGTVYFLLPQFADLPSIIDQVRDANWAWLPLILAISVATYVGATASLSGAIPERIPIGPTFTTQVGSSFASKVAPAGIGGMALNVRFLQKQGVDEAVAVTGVGLNTLAGLMGHMTLIAVFLVWAGPDAFESFRLPDPKWFLIAVAAAGVLGAIGFAMRFTRRLILEKLVPILRKAFGGVAQLARRPGKLLSLLGGSVTVTLSYLLCVYFSVEAFGGGLPLATVGAVYLVGAAVATAAPTPGGLGAVEAALIAGLHAAGLDNAVAVPAVFLYRLCTFWLPILPGWAAFTWLQRREYI